MSEKAPDQSTNLITLHSILEDMHLSARRKYNSDKSDVKLSISAFQGELYGLAGDKAKTVCLTVKQSKSVYAAFEHTDTSDSDDALPFERRIEITASLIQLGIRADCSRCTNQECVFRRGLNPTLKTQVAELYQPMDEPLR